MRARYLLVDVFTDSPLAGNALAVFPDGHEIPNSLMRPIAREMNLSETAFVTRWSSDGYDVRIFTPGAELPFAGHPTLGTAWVQHHLGRIGERTVQRSLAGDTPISIAIDTVWLERVGNVGPDLDIDVLPQLVSVESQPLLPGQGQNPGGPTASLVLTFQGDRLDPAAATDPANYRVTWLGADGLAGTADDVVLTPATASGDQAVIYNPGSDVGVSPGRTPPAAVRQTVTLLFDSVLPAGARSRSPRASRS